MPFTFPESMKAGRFLFDINTEYAGRLVNVAKRNIENDDSDTNLFRIEFEIYAIYESTERLIELYPTGAIASRDLVVSRTCHRSPRISKYAEILGITDATSPKSWHLLNQKLNSKDGIWMTIRFGTPDPEDFRQPFEHISQFDYHEDCKIQKNTPSGSRDLYLPVSKVRPLLRTRLGKSPSDDAVTKFVDKHKKQWGVQLVTMNGNQRRINWYLCWHLWEADSRTRE